MEIKLIRDTLDAEEEESLDLDEGVTAEGLLEKKGIESEEVLVARNGKIISNNQKLEDGDTVKVMDVIAGG